MLKSKEIVIIIVSSLGALFTAKLVQVFLPYVDPNLEKVFIAFLSASLVKHFLGRRDDTKNDPAKKL